MKIELTINSIIHGGKNAVLITRSGHRYPNKKWADWRNMIVDHIKALRVIDKPIEVECKLIVQYWSGDKRRRDLPAMIDSLYHIFERSGILADDCLVKELHWIPRGYDKTNPRVDFTIETL